jgi:hypothetical protein
MAELLGSDLPVMLGAEVARVAIDVKAAMGKRRDVVHLGCSIGAPLGKAHLAKTVGAPQPTQARALACPTALALGQVRR